MDTGEITPIKLSWSKIQEVAEEFRKDYIHNFDVPVAIEQIIEATMGVSVIPQEGLHDGCDMDGYISKDMHWIYVDKAYYDFHNEKFYKRIRFTIAHEIGHVILHRDIIDKIKFKSDEDWKSFRMSLQEESNNWFESQAQEFAGRLLVPVDQLIVEYRKRRELILKSYAGWNSKKINEEELFSIAASTIAPIFDVSAQVIEKRLYRENIMGFMGR
jgi:Zn-dependent peptidase ImmA (M78 family)